MKWCVAILVVALAPGVVSAQGTTQSWPGLAVESSKVSVLDDTGVETSGKLLRLDTDALVLLVGKTERRFEAARVKRIDKRGDSLRNGVIIGAIAGAAVGLLGAGLADCPGASPSGGCPGFRTAGVLVSGAFYAGVGAFIDARVAGRTTVYEAPGTSTRAARMPQRGQLAFNMTVRW